MHLYHQRLLLLGNCGVYLKIYTFEWVYFDFFDNSGQFFPN